MERENYDLFGSLTQLLKQTIFQILKMIQIFMCTFRVSKFTHSQTAVNLKTPPIMNEIVLILNIIQSILSSPFFGGLMDCRLIVTRSVIHLFRNTERAHDMSTLYSFAADLRHFCISEQLDRYLCFTCENFA